MSRPNMITPEESDMVKLTLILPIILDTLEHDIVKFKDTGLKVPNVYIANNKHLQGFVLKDIGMVKKELRVRGIKILDEGKTPTGYKATYLCRGYNHEIMLLSSLIKSLVTIRLSEMMGFPIDLLRE